MDKIVSRLDLWDMPEDYDPDAAGGYCPGMDDKSQKKEELVTRVFTQMKHLLQVATDYVFDKNLWQQLFDISVDYQ